MWAWLPQVSITSSKDKLTKLINPVRFSLFLGRTNAIWVSQSPEGR